MQEAHYLTSNYITRSCLERYLCCIGMETRGAAAHFALCTAFDETFTIQLPRAEEILRIALVSVAPKPN